MRAAELYTELEEMLRPIMSNSYVRLSIRENYVFEERLGKQVEEVIQELEYCAGGLLHNYRDFSDISKTEYFKVYLQLSKLLRTEEKAKEILHEFDEREKRAQIKKLESFLSRELDKEGSNLEEAASKIRLGEHSKSEYYLNLASKKGYWPRDEVYNPWKAEEKFEKLLDHDEELSKELAKKMREKAIKFGKKKLENRPEVIISEEAMKKANQITLQEKVVRKKFETAGLFKIEEKGKEILLTGFENIGGQDKEGAVSLGKDQMERFRGRSGRENMFWHIHPSLKDEDGTYDRLGKPDMRVMKDPEPPDFIGGGIREGIGIISIPVPNRDAFEDEVLWVAGIISSQGGLSGFLPMKVGDGSNSNITHRYEWPEIYNKWIAAAMANTSRIGPYNTYLEAKKVGILD